VSESQDPLGAVLAGAGAVGACALHAPSKLGG